YGSVVLKATADVIDIATAEYVATPHATFKKDDEKLTDGPNAKGNPLKGLPIALPGVLRVAGAAAGGLPSSPGASPTKDPEVALRNLKDSAFEEVTKVLSVQIATAINGAAPAAPARTFHIVGVKDGSAYLASGPSSGIKVGDTLQVFRMSDSGFSD